MNLTRENVAVKIHAQMGSSQPVGITGWFE